MAQPVAITRAVFVGVSLFLVDNQRALDARRLVGGVCSEHRKEGASKSLPWPGFLATSRRCTLWAESWVPWSPAVLGCAWFYVLYGSVGPVAQAGTVRWRLRAKLTCCGLQPGALTEGGPRVDSAWACEVRLTVHVVTIGPMGTRPVA